MPISMQRGDSPEHPRRALRRNVCESGEVGVQDVRDRRSSDDTKRVVEVFGRTPDSLMASGTKAAAAAVLRRVVASPARMLSSGRTCWRGARERVLKKSTDVGIIVCASSTHRTLSTKREAFICSVEAFQREWLQQEFPEQAPKVHLHIDMPFGY